MIEGLWAAIFWLELNKQKVSEGTGMLVFDSGQIMGGDSVYAYKGRYNLDSKEDKITATLSVFCCHKNLAQSVYGMSDDRFELDAVVSILPHDKLKGLALRKNFPQILMGFDLQKVANFDD